MDPSSKSRLTPQQEHLFPSPSLFDTLARAVCQAGVLPRKELFEAWEVARRTRRLMRGGRVVDLCAGHGLLAYVMLILDNTSPTAVAVDVVPPPSAARLAQALCAQWPRLHDRVIPLTQPLESLPLTAQDVVVSAHACGQLTGVVLQRAVAARARVAVLPCCHHLHPQRETTLEGWLDGPLAMDAERALWLRHQGYTVQTQHINSKVTPKNRLLLGVPCAVTPI